ncbi:hypothetical protein PRZ48_003787 [Zasmidium cellare]|uniref:Uncharacterized protein n=1 Tax=Zasmidium cellare TaxID=395010 RepID=A0ABR0EWE9_ZASCE|nr:hypothetical protein PRZ48_003787 [Zasmidium cellare]
MKELYEIDLCSYRDCLDETRLLISQVEPTAAVHPFEISTSVEDLVQNVKGHESDHDVITRARRAVSQSLGAARSYSTGYPFVATAKLRGAHFSLIIRDLDEHTLNPGGIAIQTTSLLDLIKDHSSNSGFLEHVLANRTEIIKVAKDFLARFQSLHPSTAEAWKQHPIVLAGVSNPQQFYAMVEVRSPGFLIHSLKINNEWQSLSDHYHITIQRAANIYTVANIYSTPWIFLRTEDEGQTFIEEVRKYGRDLAAKDKLWRGSCGVVLTPAPPSGLPTDGRFWLKQPAQVVPSYAAHLWEHEDWEHAPRQEKLREEAQAFAVQFCCEKRLQRAWDVVARGQLPTRHMIAPYMVEMHRLEQGELEDVKWDAVDWTKAFPRIDRLAKAWALAKIDAQSRQEGSDDWVDPMDDDTALEITEDLRQVMSY